ncbi:MAG: hypothetical protein HS104_03740 [Polyangiaceae bacterium]|nr:hypothetical protein [Polyangiaceae bacterium]MCL4750495.1 hypothetical protein [Myxococcales bacterium]
MRPSLASLGALCLVLLPSAAWATTYKVGPAQQYKQLSEVAGLLGPGDVVELDGDATYAGGVVFDRAGSAASKITIRGLRVNGKRPVVSGATNTIEAQGDHYVFEGLELTGGSFRCFYHHAHDITLRDSVIHDCPKHGLLGADQDSGSLLLEYVEVYKCGGGTFDHQIYMATDETAHPKSVFRMQHCYVHDANGGNNVKSRAERNEIYYNWIQGAMYHELELIGPDGQNEALAREDSDVVGNVLVKTASTYVVRFGGDGTGQTFGRYRFVNNTVITQAGGSAVFRLFDGIESVEMHNNVFFAEGGGPVNLLRMVEANWKSGSAVIAGSNNWYPTGSTNAPGEWTGSLTGSDPGFVSGASDPHPTAASPLLDKAGTTASAAGYEFPAPLSAPAFLPPLHTLEAVGAAQARPVVGSLDVGAYEYGTGTPGTGGSGGAATGGSGGVTTGGSGGATTGGTSAGGAPGSGGSGVKPKSGGSGGCGCRVGAEEPAGLGVWAALVFLALRRRRLP